MFYQLYPKKLIAVIGFFMHSMYVAFWNHCKIPGAAKGFSC